MFIIMKHKYSLEFWLSEKIKETLNNNQIYPCFEMYSWWTLIFNYFKLRMQAWAIFLTALVKMCSIITEGPFPIKSILSLINLIY